MYKRISTLLLAVVVLTLTLAGEVFAQANYGASNLSTVPITVSVQGTCPGGLGWITAPVVVPPGGAVLIPIPPPPCVVTGVIMNGVFYAVGFAGPTVPPNPPNRIRVGANRVVVR